MLHKKVIESKGNFRELDPCELEDVAGGDIVVTAPRPGSGSGPIWTEPGGGAGGLGSGSNPFAGAGQITPLTPEQIEALNELFEEMQEEMDEDEEVSPDPDPSPVDLTTPLDGSPSSPPGVNPPGVSREGSPTSVEVVTIGGVTFFIDIYGNLIDPRGFGGGITIPLP